MNHDPFKINEAILDLWRDLKAGEDYIDRLEIRNAELISENDSLKAEVERLHKAGDAMAAMVPAMVCCQVDAKGANDIIGAWNAAKEGKPQP